MFFADDGLPEFSIEQMMYMYCYPFLLVVQIAHCAFIMVVRARLFRFLFPIFGCQVCAVVLIHQGILAQSPDLLISLEVTYFLCVGSLLSSSYYEKAAPLLDPDSPSPLLYGWVGRLLLCGYSSSRAGIYPAWVPHLHALLQCDRKDPRRHCHCGSGTAHAQ